ncbi:MAG: 4'-phosphopantetheinyl transferase superfamily protein [Gammaproteobacteria bacterium]|nr:4'-phosphopantetheinyl transferase superfamily protein [Gammaproteobacteria bacterium]MBM4230058.1 4'-phosphopantetheinyl transferase superfamily protein [Gammaproteobacteria bacterium]
MIDISRICLGRRSFPVAAKYCTGGTRPGIVRRIVSPIWSPLAFRALRHREPPRGIELYFANLAAFSSLMSSPADRELLSRGECDRADSMTAAQVRHDFVVSRILLRSVLASRLGVAGGALSFVLSEHGKPLISSAAGQPLLHFNQSHSHGAWLLGLGSEAAIGVDLETRRTVPNARRLAERVFTDAERAELTAAQCAAAEADSADVIFLRGWTRKEAVLKAAGSGFTWNARELQVGTGRGSQRVSLPKLPGQVASVSSLDLPIEGQAAVATLSSETDFASGEFFVLEA